MKICIYGASGQELPQPYFDAARELGRLLAGEGHSLIFGGGAHGLMGAPHCSRFVYTETMAQRKTAMFEESEAFIALPGGIGTFEEFFETLTLKQLGRHRKPMALLNTLGYYEPLTALLERAAKDGFLSRRCFRLYGLCRTPRQALDHVLSEQAPAGGLDRLEDYTR